MSTDGKRPALSKIAPAHQSSKKAPRIAFAIAAGSLMLTMSGEAKGVHQKGPDFLPETQTSRPRGIETLFSIEDLHSKKYSGTTERKPKTPRPVCFNSGNSLIGIFQNHGYDIIPSLFSNQERKREVVCTESMAHILTDHRLIQIPFDDGGFMKGFLMFDSLENIRDIGLAAWAQSDIADFLITNDARISVITLTKLSKTYILPTGINQPKMTTHEGFVFISNGLGSLIVANTGMRHVVVPIICDKNGDFFMIDDNLFFGRKGSQKCSISIQGNDVAGAKVERK